MMSFNVRDLTLDNIGQLPSIIKLSLVTFLSFLVIVVGYWLLVQDNLNQYQSLQAVEVTLRHDFEAKQQQAANLQAYRVQMSLMEDRFGTMLKQLPTQNEMPGLLEDISKTGIASGLTFELFAPQPEVIHDFYIEVPIKIRVMGNYHEFAVFLSRVAMMSRIVTLHDLSIRIASEGTDKKTHMNGDQLSMDITAKIYRYRTK
ncbi:MAG: type 4a pilus biogenesis protein PilO [Legionellales bacterium]|nr:type 4a pilus biogenesis protein PilO [Legionellales bacterium]